MQHMEGLANPPGSMAAGSVAGLRLLALVIPLLGAALAEGATAPGPLQLRNQHPLLQTLGAPAMQGGQLAAAGELEHRWVLSMANHADAGAERGEQIILDGESYYTELLLRYGLGSRLEVGADLPLVAHTSGIFDNAIEAWHDVFGLSNTLRDGPSNRLRLLYQRDGNLEYDIDDSAVGLGDIRLNGAFSLADRGGRALALRAQIELPTGDADELRGNGAVDAALALEVTDRQTLVDWRIDLFGRIGMVAPGSGDLLKELQEDWVPFAGAGLAWRWTERLDLHAQFDYQGSYFDSALDELGDTTQLMVGASYRFGSSGLRLTVAVLEDLVSDASPDFGLYFSLAIER